MVSQLLAVLSGLPLLPATCVLCSPCDTLQASLEQHQKMFSRLASAFRLTADFLDSVAEARARNNQDPTASPHYPVFHMDSPTLPLDATFDLTAALKEGLHGRAALSTHFAKWCDSKSIPCWTFVSPACILAFGQFVFMHTSRWLTHVFAHIIPLNPSLLWAHTLYQAFNASSHHNTSPLSSFAPHPMGHHESLPIFSPTWSLKGARQDLQPNWDHIESTLSSPSFKGCLIFLPDSFPVSDESPFLSKCPSPVVTRQLSSGALAHEIFPIPRQDVTLSLWSI